MVVPCPGSLPQIPQHRAAAGCWRKPAPIPQPPVSHSASTSRSTAADVEVAVQFKAVAGRVDQAAGLVARLQDQENYYITRANALENNVRLYKVVRGKRTQFAGADVPVASGRWHSLKLVVQGPQFQVFLNDTLLLTAKDTTITAAGKVGLWTKADSVTYFDDLSIVSHDTR